MENFSAVPVSSTSPVCLYPSLLQTDQWREGGDDDFLDGVLFIAGFLFKKKWEHSIFSQ